MDNKELIYLSALRYALGRRTYITSVVSEFLEEQELTVDCREIMARDIRDAEKRNCLGDNCDKEDWMRLLNHLNVWSKYEPTRS